LRKYYLLTEFSMPNKGHVYVFMDKMVSFRTLKSKNVIEQDVSSNCNYISHCFAMYYNWALALSLKIGDLILEDLIFDKMRFEI